MVGSRSNVYIFAFLFSLIFVSFSVLGQERILSYDSFIDINKDGSMIVTETIQVKAEEKQIRRGIYRDFPTYYVNNFGIIKIVGFEVKGVSRDGDYEPWIVKEVSNGVRVYIGNPRRYLLEGVYTYKIRYKTTRQIGFFENNDELYWNVTGNGWSFPIDKASATVRLPFEIGKEKITMEGYTGRSGSKGQAYKASVLDDGGEIQVTRKLNKNEGLTLVMTWPKGISAEPVLMQRYKYFLNDNLALLMGLFSLIMVFIFQYRAWLKVGRDPKPGVIFPHYNPPKGYSPAASRYISEMAYDNKVLTAAIVNLAVKGYLTITRIHGDYILNKNSSVDVLAAGEKVLLNKLFDKRDELKLESWNHDILSKAKSAHEGALKRNYLNIYFSHNSGRIWLSVLATVAMFILTLVMGSITGSSVFPIFIVPFVFIIIMSIAFTIIMKAPSKKGRELMDKLDGFKMYLKVAEKDDLNLRHPPDKTPELFEHYLPFAIALNVEQAWAEQFTKVFAALSASNTQYHPEWYVGDFNSNHLNIFTMDVSSSFTSTISSASIDPTVSSGSGGGGSSGGGGGGGGGGGW